MGDTEPGKGDEWNMNNKVDHTVVVVVAGVGSVVCIYNIAMLAIPFFSLNLSEVCVEPRVMNDYYIEG